MLDKLIFTIAFSSHIGLSGDFAEVHPHIQYKLPDNYITGVYHNSDKRASIYLGKRTTYQQTEIEYGLVHGYKRMDVAPLIKVNFGKIFIAPAATEDEVGIVTGLEVKF